MGLSYHQGKNAAYLSEIHVIKKSSIDFPDLLLYLRTLRYENDLTTEENFQKIDFLPGSGLYNQKKTKKMGVNTFDISIACKINKKQVSTTEWLQMFDNNKLVLLCKDNNNEGHIMVGSDEHHALMTYSENISNTNLIDISFNCRQLHSPYYYSGVFSSN